MMTSLITKTLYQKRRFIIGWSIGLFALSLFMMLLFPTLQKSELGQLFAGLSPALQKVAGGKDSFSTPDAYISGELFALRLPLLFIVLSIMLFSSLTVGDERRGLLATQLSLPFSRAQLLAEKLVVAIVILLAVAVSTVLGVVAGLLIIHDPINAGQLIKHMLGCLLVGFDFGLIVFAVGAGLGKGGAATGLASGVAFMSYVISSLTAVAASLKPYEKLSLFHYYQNPSPISGAHAGLLLYVAAILIGVGLVAFTRRDIK